MKYNDYPDKYPNQIIEKLNLAYEKELKKDVYINAFNKDFFKGNFSNLLDQTVTISSENKCELEGLLVNLIEGLNNCERYLFEIKKLDAKNKKHLSGLIKTTQDNKVEIANCCYNNYDISCDYYATSCPSFNFCCANYCCAELDVLDQLLNLNCNPCFPFNRLALLKLTRCRLGCLNHIINTYSLKRK